jgi:uncharacterized protein YbaR (Trm112 family)
MISYILEKLNVDILRYHGLDLIVCPDSHKFPIVGKVLGYIQFLKELFLNLSDLGGDVDVIPELQNSFIASSTLNVDILRYHGLDLIVCPDSHKFPIVGKVLGLETELAQDIYIQFLKELFLNLSDLGGDVDVIPELQNSFIA